MIAVADFVIFFFMTKGLLGGKGKFKSSYLKKVILKHVNEQPFGVSERQDNVCKRQKRIDNF